MILIERQGASSDEIVGVGVGGRRVVHEGFD